MLSALLVQTALADALKGGKPVVAVFGRAELEVPSEFTRVDVRSDRREVRIYAPGGTLMSRFFSHGADRLRRETAWALDELARKTPREIPLPAEGRDLIGTTPPAWTPDAWLRGKPADGVTLVRFFTNTCPYCAASMPALQKLHESYPELRVYGFYHPKPFGAERSRDSVENLLDEWGVTFPVALDTKWTTLEAWWLDAEPRSATSVSLLIDRSGAIRWLHPGPDLHPSEDPEHAECDRQFRALEGAVKTLLAEK